MFNKIKSKWKVKISLGLVGIASSFLILSSPSLININNINVLDRAMAQNRAFTAGFNHSRVKATTNSIIRPLFSNINYFKWIAILGHQPTYGTRYYSLFESGGSGENAPIILFNGQPWDYTWSNYDLYGPPSTQGPSFIKNYLNITQYNSDTSNTMLNLTPNYLYTGELCHQTCASKTQSYVMSYPSHYQIDTSNPVVFTMSKVIKHHVPISYNYTNENKAEIDEQGYNRRPVRWDANNQINQIGYFFYGKDNNTNGALNSATTSYSSFIVARDRGKYGYNNIYALNGSTRASFRSLESSTMPPQSNRGDILATEWAKELMSSNKTLLEFYGENAIPSTFYSLNGNVVADNLKGTLTIKVRTGTLFNRNQVFSNNSQFKYPDKIFSYSIRNPEYTTFEFSGFRKVKPTQLATKIDANNPYIQPQYVTVDEIKKIILAKGIIGTLPDGFTIDNILFTDIRRFNTTGTIRATTYLNFYFDNKGDLQTSNFTPINVTIEGWAKTNFSALPNSISVKNLGLGNVLPTDVSVDMIKDIIFNTIVENRLIWEPGVVNENACFPQNFSRDDLIIRNGSVTTDNISGTIRVNIMVDNFFNDAGEISSYQVSLGLVTLRDFKRVQPTVLANNAYDYEDPSNELYPTDVAANLVLLKNYISLQIPDFMKPSNFYPDRDVQLSNLVANNKDGTIYVTVSLNNYYDAKGVVRQTGFKPKEIIFNFNNSISETNLPIEINVSSTHNEISAHQFNEEDIKTLIYDNIVLGRPKDFTTNNIKFDILPQWESSKGKIIVTPILDYWVDENGYFRTDPKKFQKITIHGFKGSPITSFNKKILATAGLPSWIPSSVAKHQDLLKDIILKGVSGKPTNFNANNIEIISTTPNNIEGILDVEVSLNYWNDSNGNPQTSGFNPTTISIGGFGVSEMPTTIISYILGDSDRIAQSYTQKDLKDIIMENINYPVVGMNHTNISFKNLDYDYINGRISFTPVLNLWVGEDLEIHTEPRDFPTVTIGNLKTVRPTTINKSSLNIGNPDVEASEFAENYTLNLLPLIDTIIENKPDSWNLNTSLELRNIVHNDLRGEITMDVVLNNYYNHDGLLKSEGFNPETITITGFKQITGATSISKEIELKGFENVYPFEVTKTQIKQLIFENLQNKAPGLSIHNISLYSSLEINNFGGTIKVTPAVNAYYNEEGEIILKNIQLNEVTFKNFKKSPGTTILSSNKIKGDPNLLAGEAAKDISSLKQKVYDNLINPPDNFNIETDIEIENLFYDNISATISFDVVLKKIYDKKGTIISGEFDFGNITIDGFLAASGYTSIPSRIQATTPNLYASDINENELRTIIFNNTKNKPNQLTINDVFIKEGSIVVDNRLGIIKLVPILNWTYNVFGELVNIPKEFDQVTIHGYRKSTQTSIPITTISANRFSEIANLYPNELASNLNLIKQISMKLVDLNTVPTGFNIDNIEIQSINSDNYTGSINFDIKLNYYFDKNGIIQRTNFQPVTITIVDMLSSKGLTSILRVINSNNKSKTPENVTEDEIKQLILNNISNAPPGFSKNDISFKVEPDRNNLNGSIKVIPILNKSYNINSDLITTPIEFSEITINGYATTTPTRLSRNQINYHNTTILPSNLAKDIDALKEVVKNNLVSTPPSFSLSNISINPDDIIYDNISGNLTFGFYLNHYYNEKGLLVNDNSELYWITINKLLSISKTVPNNNEFILSGVQATLPSDYSDEKIINYIKTNLSSVLFNYIPENFDVDVDLVVSIREKDNLTGSIDVIVKLKKYYNSSGELIITDKESDYASFVLTLNGFNSSKPTNLVSEVTIYNQESILAQSVAYDISLLNSIVTNNINNIFNNLPPNFSLLDIVIPKNYLKSFDNKEGSITVEIGVKNYYDKNGNHVKVVDNSNDILKGIVKIKGFMTNLGTTIVPKFSVSNYENVLPTSITNSDIRTIIMNNSKQIFSSLPSSSSLNGNLDVQILSAHNQTGEVIAKVSIYEYFNKNGDKITKQDNLPLIQNVIFNGFNSLSPTYISNEIFIKDQSNNLATSMNEQQLKTLLYENLSSFIINLPNDFSIENNLNINILQANNVTGQIIIEVSLNYYVNDYGIIVNATNETEILNNTVIINGFKKVNQTLILDEVNLYGYNKVNPRSITNEDLKNIIKNNLDYFFVNLPENFTHDQLIVNILSVDQTKGTIYAKTTLTTYYDVNESLIIDGSLSQVIKINGFRSNKSPGSSTTTLIAVSITAGILTVTFVAGLLFSLKLGRKKIKL